LHAGLPGIKQGHCGGRSGHAARDPDGGTHGSEADEERAMRSRGDSMSSGAALRPGFDFVGHGFIALTLLFTVYGQLVLKWQMGGAGPLPDGAADKLLFLLRQFLNPWVFSGFVSAFIASLAWMAAMTRFDLAYAYPFMSLAFVIVMVFGALFLGESVNPAKAVGTLLVVAGLVMISRA
jgi:drug/metabolite transporter (DMT)-like permease